MEEAKGEVESLKQQLSEGKDITENGFNDPENNSDDDDDDTEEGFQDSVKVIHSMIPVDQSIEKWRNMMLGYGMFLNFVMKGTVGVFETLTVVIATRYFQWDSIKIGSLVSAFGVIGVIILANFHFLLHYSKDYRLVPFGMIFMILSCFLLNNHYYFFTISSIYNNYLFIFSLFFMIAIGYPIGHTTLIGLYSRLLKMQEKQGTALGLFASIGSLARIVFPISAGLIADYTEHFDILFLSLGVLLVISFIGYLFFESTLIKLLH
jgi:MFS-type transporter involved in bile tolerance (Atg22 family)